MTYLLLHLPTLPSKCQDTISAFVNVINVSSLSTVCLQTPSKPNAHLCAQGKLLKWTKIKTKIINNTKYMGGGECLQAAALLHIVRQKVVMTECCSCLQSPSATTAVRLRHRHRPSWAVFYTRLWHSIFLYKLQSQAHHNDYIWWICHSKLEWIHGFLLFFLQTFTL